MVVLEEINEIKKYGWTKGKKEGRKEMGKVKRLVGKNKKN
jgi:hypothetical protein